MRRKTLTLIYVLVMTFALGACQNGNNAGNAMGIKSNGKQAANTDEQNNPISKDSAIDNGGLTFMEDSRVKLTFNNEEVIVNMYDNPTSRDFLTQLPLTLTFEDYATTEKISYLDRKLFTKDAPAGTNASVGDFTYYSPWGNLAIFYRDFGFANGLIKLGSIESGIEKLASMKGNFTVTIENID
jgi:hypothetical protein